MSERSWVLVLNCGSSSIKFAVISPESAAVAISGIVERIGLAESFGRWERNGIKQREELPDADYDAAINYIVKTLQQQLPEILKELVAVGHRVVHGGEKFTDSALITAEVLAEIRNCSELAPLHNPANLQGIINAQKAFPELPQVAVFDTAFHQSMEAHAYLYALPYSYYQDYGVRRYGFHGTSHRYVTAAAAKFLNKPLTESAFISAHLGNGCSIAAVLNGNSVDTSMGLTPLEGLIMGTRSGDLDPGLLQFLGNKLNYDLEQLTELLNKQSGLLGIFGSSDMRDIEEAAMQGDKQALLAEQMFSYRIAKYILAYTAPLGCLDALVFTGGIGEHSARIREQVLNYLPILNFSLDHERNNNNGKDSGGVITRDGTPLAIIIPTNEELMIARDAAQLI